MKYTFLYFLFPLMLEAKLLVFTIAFSCPEFIALQERTLQEFLVEDYDRIIYINAEEGRMAKKLMEKCEQYNIPYKRIPTNIHPELCDHGKALEYAFKDILQAPPESLLLLENDCFFIRPFSIERQFDAADLAFVPRSVFTLGDWETGPYGNNPKKAFYINPQFVFFRPGHLPCIETLTRWERIRLGNMLLDTGGPTHHYLKKHKTLRKQYLNSTPFLFTTEDVETTQSQAPDFMQEDLANLLQHCGTKDAPLQFFCDYTILHYGGGCNWGGHSRKYREKKYELITRLIQNSINYHKYPRENRLK